MRINIRTAIQGNYKEVLKRFDRELFEELTPPGARIELIRFDGSHKGDTVHIRMKLLGMLKQDWVSEVVQEGETERRAWFSDEGVKLPFFLSYWKHNHIIENHGTHSVIVDDIQFSGPNLILDPFLWPVLYLQFLFRRPVYKRIFGAVTPS